MNKILIFFFSTTLLSACLSNADEAMADFDAPIISAASGNGHIEPLQMSSISSTDSEITLTFKVEDPSGISQILIESHSGFDGHSHGRMIRNSDFVLFNYYEVIDEEILSGEKVFEKTVNMSPKIYLDDRNSEIMQGGLILAGPHHFSIKATDLEGNETSYADNSTYHTTLFIQRDYAPLVTINNFDKSTGNLDATIARNFDHESSSDIIFLWVHVSVLNEVNPSQEGEVLEEWIWGNSNWPHQFRANSGEPLPNEQNINLGELLSNETELLQISEGEILTIWAEDANGNISVKTIQ